MLSYQRITNESSFNCTSSNLTIDSKNNMFQGPIYIQESTYMVDGIGGTTWDGSILICEMLVFLKSILNSCNIIELGAGTGVCGILASALGAKESILSDREIDLIERNISFNSEHHLLKGSNLYSFPLDWGLPEANNLKCMHVNNKKIDLLIGAEITCLIKQQSLLVDTINVLADEDTMIILSFDECSSPISKVRYEELFNIKMEEKGFHHRNLIDANVKWYKDVETNQQIDESCMNKSYVYKATFDIANSYSKFSKDLFNNLDDISRSEGPITSQLHHLVIRFNYYIVLHKLKNYNSRSL